MGPILPWLGPVRRFAYVEGYSGTLKETFERLVDDLDMRLDDELPARPNITKAFSDITLQTPLAIAPKKLVLTGAGHAVSYHDEPSIADFIRETMPEFRVKTIVSSEATAFHFGNFQTETGPASTDQHLHFPLAVLPMPLLNE